MKYIKPRYKINETFLNPNEHSDVNVEWDDTLLGALFNKIYGKGKNEIKTKKIGKIADQLDAAIAKLFLTEAKNKDAEIKDTVEKAETEKAYEVSADILSDIKKALPEGKTVLQLTQGQKSTLITAIDDVLKVQIINDDTDIKGALTASKEMLMITQGDLPEITEQDLENIIKGTKIKYLVNEKEILGISVGEVVDGKLQVTDETGKNITEINTDDITYIWKDKDAKEDSNDTVSETVYATDTQIEELKAELKKMLTIIDKIIEKTTTDGKTDVVKDLEQFKLYCQKADEIKEVELKKYEKIMNFIKQLNEFYDFMGQNKQLDYQKLLAYFKVNEAENSNTVMKISNSELTSRIDTAINKITKKFIEYRVTKEEVEKIDKMVKKYAADMVTGANMREIVGIISRAKDFIVFNNYTGLQKRQKRYYLPIEGDFSLHKASFDAWSNRVNKIVAYYKDLMPDNLKEFLLASTDHEAFKNYNGILKKYLGFDADYFGVKKGTKKYSDLEEEDRNKKLTTPTKNNNTAKDNTFLPVDETKIELYKPFVMRGDKDFIVCMPIFIYKNVVLCKYKSNNTDWLYSYLPFKAKTDNKDVVSKTDNAKNPVKFLAFNYPQKGYMKAKRTEVIKFPFNIIDEIKKGEKKNVILNEINIRKIYTLFDTNKVNSTNFDKESSSEKIIDPADLNQGNLEKNGDQRLRLKITEMQDILDELKKILKSQTEEKVGI